MALFEGLPDVIGSRRAQDAPPVDALAEALVLDHVITVHPHHMEQLDLRPLLVFPEHRLMWQIACRVRMRHPDLGTGEFYVEWLRELFTSEPERSKNILDLLESAHEHEVGRAFELTTNGQRQGYDFWLERLQRIANARRLISTAQQIAERAWQEDVDGAQAIAARIVPRRAIADAVLEV